MLAIAPSLASAQEASSTAPAATQPAAAASAADQLTDIAGVRSGMTNEALVELAAGYLQNGPRNDAQRILETIRKADPNHARASRLLADLYDQQAQAARESGDPSQTQEAEALENKAITIYLDLGAKFFTAGDAASAERLFGHVLKRQSGHALARLNLARLYASTARPLLSIECYRDYFANPTSKDEPDTLAKAYLEFGQICRINNFRAQAISALQSSEKLNPEDPLVHLALAQTYLDATMLDKARLSAGNAVRRAPSDPQAREVLAKTLLAARELPSAQVEAQRAVDLARQSIQQMPESLELVQGIDQYYRTLENVLRAMLLKEPGKSTVRVDLARTMREHADWRRVLSLHEALRVLRDAPQQDAANPRILELVAELQFAVSARAQAEATCRELLKIEAQNATAVRILKSLATPGPTSQAVAEKPGAPAPGS